MAIHNRLMEKLYAYQLAHQVRLTQSELAKRVWISYPTLLRYLNNTCSSYDPEVMERFCQVLEFPVEEFFHVGDSNLVQQGRSGRRRTLKT
jgi:transcriptional regulator with XRE-family HTH domain